VADPLRRIRRFAERSPDGQVGQMLNQITFWWVGNLEGAFLIGIASIIYSLAIG